VFNGTVCSDHSRIREHIMQFYDNLFTEWFSWCPRSDGISLDSNEGRRPLGWRDSLRIMRSLRL
jgi:hypothetical protein